MTEYQRAVLQLLIETEWMDAKANYAGAGRPSGERRGMDIWIEFGQLTTVD